MTKEEQAAKVLATHQGCEVSEILDTERILIGQDVILPAMQEYADLRCKPLVDCLIDLKWRYSESEWIVAQIEKALQDYNKK